MEFLKASLGNASELRSHPVYWSLPIRLCEAYVAFSHLEKGMSSLHHMLLNDTVPSNRLGSFCYLLALIYSKKGWYKDSFEVLDLLNHPLRASLQIVETSSIENVVVLHLARDKPSMGFVAIPPEQCDSVSSFSFLFFSVF